MRAIDRCAQTNRWRHVAAGEKLLVSIGAMIVALAAAGWIGQLVVLVSMTALTRFGAGVSVRDLLRAARVPLAFVLTGTLAQIVTVSMHGWWPSVSLVSGPQMIAAGFIALRSIACIAALLFLALTTPLSSLLQLLQRIGLNAEISDLAMAMLRLVWLTLDCLDNGQKALSARLGYVDNRRMIRSQGMLLAALLPRVLNRASRMETGLAARGYSGRLQFLTIENRASPVRLGLIAIGFAVFVAASYWFNIC